MANEHRRQFRNYLLDRQFQLRYTLAIVLISATLTSGLGYFWYDEMRNASKLVEVKALATMDDEEIKLVEADLGRRDQVRLMILVGFGGLIAVVLAGYGIIFTHKSAGPIFKIRRHMEDIRDGHLHELWDLRKGDQMQAFWDVFREMHTALRERTFADIQTLEQTLHLAEAVHGKQADMAGQIQLLRNLIQAKRDSLKREGADPTEQSA